MAQETKPPKWPEIEAAARELGVKDWALSKWLQRGVPGKWHVPLMLQSKGRLSPKDFAQRETAA